MFSRLRYWFFTLSLMVGAIITGESAVTYNDVAVIVNTNSANSLEIGTYFQNARSIPAANMIYVSVDTTEEIDSAAFNSLKGQVENHLITNNLVDSIDYLVTTKGVPLKINRGDTFSTTSPSASVESELMLILGSYSSYIGGAGKITSPYYYQSEHFSRAVYGIYLVTRLDAYTVHQVLDLIDRGGPGISVDGGSAYVFDQDPAWDSTIPTLNMYLASAATTLESRGKEVDLDQSTVYVTEQRSVIGYTSWGSNDHYANNYTTYAIPHNSWARGAIAETYVSTSGRSFEPPPTYGQSLIADLIQEGITGVKGYVYEPYSSAMALAYILFDRYSSGFNLAESFSMASRYSSWMDVIIGDPKTSIDGPPISPLPIQLQHFSAQMVGNENSVILSWGTASELNNFGFYVQRQDSGSRTFQDIPWSFVQGHGTTLIPQEYSWTHVNVSAGTHAYRLRQIDMDGTVHYTESISIAVNVVASVDNQSGAARFSLSHNYPNPFNPVTVIQYQNPGSGHVKLSVFDSRGEHVSTLVDEVQSEGSHSITFSAKENGLQLASGVYYYRIEFANSAITKKMVLLR